MIRKAALALAMGFMAVTAGGQAAAETVVVGHFGIPTPFQLAAEEKKFEAATGWTIEWRKFAAGTDVIAAMASGDLMVAELGSSPLAIAASQGVDLKMFLLADVIGDAESLVARNGAGIATVADLKGKRIGVPVGSTSHFSLMGALAHAGIATGDVTIMNMPPDQIVAAFQQDAIDAGFVWDPALSKLLETGTRIVGAGQTAEWGYPTFDAWVVNAAFADANKEALIAFTKVIAEANAAYLADPSAWTADSEPVKVIAARTGAEPDQVPPILSGYTFLPPDVQAGEAWLGGGLAKAMGSTAAFLKEAGRIDQALEDYSAFVTPEFAAAAAK